MSLAVDQLTASYDSAVVVRGVSFQVQEGETFVLLGKNGMGKTSTVKAMLGFVDATGAVTFGGERVDALPPYLRIRKNVAYGPQDAAIFADLSVSENLRLGEMAVHSSQRSRDLVLAHFPILGARLTQRAGTLSGGEQKMLILARALLAEPAILLLDEISEGLQPSMVDAVVRVIREERARRKLTILMIEQNVDFALKLADRVGVMRVGELLFEAPASDLDVRQRLIEALSL